MTDKVLLPELATYALVVTGLAATEIGRRPTRTRDGGDPHPEVTPARQFRVEKTDTVAVPSFVMYATSRAGSTLVPTGSRPTPTLAGACEQPKTSPARQRRRSMTEAVSEPWFATYAVFVSGTTVMPAGSNPTVILAGAWEQPEVSPAWQRRTSTTATFPSPKRVA
jgi:hypothetical protein